MAQKIMSKLRNEFGCNPKTRCSDTNTAWREGCRHPGAVAAHEAWMDRRDTRKQEVARIAAAGGGCTAATHGTRYAYEESGCVCPEALRVMEEHWRRADKRKKMGREGRRRRDQDYAREYEREEALVKRLTGGRLRSDPRRPWRGGKMAVSAFSVALLMGGMCADPTERERLVAVILLSRKRVWQRRVEVPSGYRPLTNSEIGRMMGANEQTVARMARLRKRLIEQRTARRLADSRWRAAYTAAGADRRRGR